jgi:hypothetical protein
VSRVKRYLEDQTDSVLDSLRLYGSAVIVEARESDRYGWGGGPYALLSRTLETLAQQWLCGPSREASERLSAATLALSQSQTVERTVTVPPLEEADAISNWREALEDAVEEAVEALAEWLAPYGLRLEWETVGLCAVPEDEEWSTAHSEGVWRGARQ